MEILEQTARWLSSWPGWEGKKPGIDCLGNQPGDIGLFPKGMEPVKSWEDVLGTRCRRTRCRFLLQYVGSDPDGTDAEKILALQQWVQDQDGAGLAPSFGTDTRWQAGEGRLSGSKGVGTGVYSVTLTATFTTKI